MLTWAQFLESHDLDIDSLMRFTKTGSGLAPGEEEPAGKRMGSVGQYLDDLVQGEEGRQAKIRRKKARQRKLSRLARAKAIANEKRIVKKYGDPEEMAQRRKDRVAEIEKYKSSPEEQENYLRKSWLAAVGKNPKHGPFG